MKNRKEGETKGEKSGEQMTQKKAHPSSIT
jgi:hypothetical protein